MDLSEFLNARIAETEKIARNCWGDDQAGWWHYTGGEHVADDDGATVCEAVMSNEAIHIARWDPAHVLAWCAAVRVIVAEHHHVEGCGCLHNAHGHQFGCRTCHEDQGYVLSAGWCDTLLALAQPFAGHPDFDPAWR